MPVQAAHSPLSDLAQLGIGIARSDPDHQEQTHVGILYRHSGEVRMSHLAFHLRFSDQSIDDVLADMPELHWASSGEEEQNRNIAAAFLANFRLNKQNIPFGYDSTGCVFDKVTAKFIPGPPGRGLTCATFVTGLFRYLQLPILREEFWPSRAEDTQWQERMLKTLQRYCDKHEIDCTEHVAAMQQTLGTRRIRPEEAAAGVILTDTPAEFVEARQLAEQIMAMLPPLMPTEPQETGSP